jgi:hypothetical protein
MQQANSQPPIAQFLQQPGSFTNLLSSDHSTKKNHHNLTSSSNSQHAKPNSIWNLGEWL